MKLKHEDGKWYGADDGVTFRPISNPQMIAVTHPNKTIRYTWGGAYCMRWVGRVVIELWPSGDATRPLHGEETVALLGDPSDPDVQDQARRIEAAGRQVEFHSNPTPTE
jgi:hypothetical protein